MPSWYERRMAEIEKQTFEAAERIGVRSSGIGRRLKYEEAIRTLDLADEQDRKQKMR